MNNARDLSCHLADLLRREHHALAEFLVGLAGFDRERRWLELGYTSCFYLHRELGLSKGAAFYRKTAAELIQRFPELVEPLRDGRLCLSSVAELAKVITPENRGEVMPRFFHTSKQEAKVVAAELRPVEVAPRREVVTVLCPTAARPEPEPASEPAAARAIALDLAHPVHPENQPKWVYAPSPTRSSPSPPSCAGTTSPSRSASSQSSPRRATPSRTAIRAPAPRRCWRPRSTFSSRRRPSRGGSWRTRARPPSAPPTGPGTSRRR